MTVQQAYRDITFAGGGVHRAAWQVSADGNSLAAPAGRPCAVVANGFCGSKDTALLDCVALHGHIGWSKERPLQAMLRDVSGYQIGDGTPQIQKMIIARDLYSR
ncbi:acyl-CoA dehydrogenase family protein [Nocardia sp. NPDC059228]|uniref:acyl-CoA dehydrogenase family protein n=1 Tax=Nocardia sp. NPDC059228 TaxID=3346777 RepID=UPI0036B104C3